jgi:hypothetical protein
VATSARASAGFGRTPDYKTANEAIDSVLANAAFDQRSTNLRKKTKRAERQYKAISRRELARGKAYEAAGEVVTGAAGSTTYANEQVAAANRRLEQLNKRWEEQAEKQLAQWSADFAQKKKYADLQGKERKQAWDDYYQRKARQLDIYRQIQQQQAIAKSLDARAQSSYSTYQRQAAALEAAKKRYTAMSKRSKVAFRAWEAATNRYNRFSQYVPYRPA